MASLTAKSHMTSTASQLTLYGNSFCPFAHRIWIALEIKQIPYQYVEVIPPHIADTNPLPAALLEANPEGHIPCLRHGNFGVWESGVMMEYLEDLAMGHSLLPLGNAQLRAHCRLWLDHINRKILPAFYALLLTPPTSPRPPDNDQHTMLVTTLQNAITLLVNASHATGPFFLGPEISYVDVAFAPWIIRLDRVLAYYRHFPRPEVGTRWQMWADAIDSDDRVRRTVSDDNSYHGVYRGVGEDGWDERQSKGGNKAMVEMSYAKRVLGREGFGLGGDIWGRLPEEAGGEDL